jgi:hypothetical protein
MWWVSCVFLPAAERCLACIVFASFFVLSSVKGVVVHSDGAGPDPLVRAPCGVGRLQGLGRKARRRGGVVTSYFVIVDPDVEARKLWLRKEAQQQRIEKAAHSAK